MEYMHYLWDFIELYFLWAYGTFKDIKSVLGSLDTAST